MPAPRIDTVRKTANTLIHRIAEALEHLDDLHAIGWYRHADHRARERVSGSVDVTAVGIDLDNHGDPTYRAAYEQLAKTLLTAHDDIAHAVDDALQHFAAGKITTRRDTTADATSDEVIAAIAAQARRRATGQPGSTPTIDQPLPTNARRLLQIERLAKELDDLRNAVRKSGVRPERGRLTPAEVDAWQTALGTKPGRRKKGRNRP